MSILNVALLFLLIGFKGFAAPSGTGICYKFYHWSEISRIKPDVIRTHDVIWNLENDLIYKDNLAIPSRWKSMVQHTSNVRVLHHEKVFTRRTASGEKYDVAYFVYQPQSGKYKSTIVLQHGFAESSIYFKTQIRTLVAMGFRVIAMDGANSGNTLLYTLRKLHRALFAPSPVEDGRALAEILLAEIPAHEKFIVLGHSRGFLVTSLMLSTGLFDKQLIQHISSNGYDSWKVDELVDRPIMNPFRLVPVLDTMTDYWIGQMRSMARQGANQISDPILRDRVMSHQGMKSREELGVELADEITRRKLVEATMGIARGLKGQDQGLPGIETLSLYETHSDLKNVDNGFGFEVANNPLKIGHISAAVKDRTLMVFGDKDHLVSMESSRKIIDQVGFKPIVLGKDIETGVEATHFLPNERPFELLELILQAYKENRDK
ncbi:MAG: alpha/beta hydrolase [Bdellovibrionaceae bacterium]|nr:alpha/beta hydrolase [Pseudobdellovibrionaceae bacterium]